MLRVVVVAHRQMWEDFETGHNAVDWIFAATHPYFSLGSTMRSPHHHHLDHPVRVTTDILEDVYFAIRWSLREDR